MALAAQRRWPASIVTRRRRVDRGDAARRAIGDAPRRPGRAGGAGRRHPRRAMPRLAARERAGRGRSPTPAARSARSWPRRAAAGSRTFVGGHPLAGRHAAGPRRRAPICSTAGRGSSRNPRRARRGAPRAASSSRRSARRPVVADRSRRDTIALMASVSHLPQVVASALMHDRRRARSAPTACAGPAAGCATPRGSRRARRRCGRACSPTNADELAPLLDALSPSCSSCAEQLADRLDDARRRCGALLRAKPDAAPPKSTACIGIIDRMNKVLATADEAVAADSGRRHDHDGRLRPVRHSRESDRGAASPRHQATSPSSATTPASTTSASASCCKARQVRKMISTYVGENKEFERQFLPASSRSSWCRRARSPSASAPAAPASAASSRRPATARWSPRARRRAIIDGRHYVLETPLHADFAFVKAWKGDRLGNLVYRRPRATSTR